MRRFWGPAQADLDAALDNLGRRFPTAERVEAEIARVRKGWRDAHQFIDPPVVGRLAQIADFYRDRATIGAPGARETEPAYWRARAPIPPEVLRAGEQEYQNVIARFTAARGQLINEVEDLLKRPASNLCEMGDHQ